MKKSALKLIGLLVFYLITVLPHEEVGAFISGLFENYERSSYNLFIAILAVGIFIGIWVYSFPKIKKHPEKKKIAFYIIANSILVLLCFKILFVVNIEAIHFFQYALFAIGCYYVTENYFRTLIIGSLAGFFDELFQYVILAPEKSRYFDFNDVILDIIGLGIGLTIVKIYFPTKKANRNLAFLKLPELWVLLGIIISYFLGSALGFISVLQNPDSPTVFTLLKYLPSKFWTIYPAQSIKFHILLPMEGIALIILLWLFYFPLGRNKS